MDLLEKKGLALELVPDLDRVSELVKQSGKTYLTPVLDPLQNDFVSQNCFWLVAKRDDVPVLLGGARIDDLGAESPEFILRQFERGYGKGVVSKVDERVRSQVKGRAAYFGDLFSSAASGLGRKNVRFFVAVANYLAVAHYRADCVYSFMRGVDVLRGSADTNGFTQRNLDPLTWARKPVGRGDGEQLVYRDASENAAYFEAVRRELACTQSGSALHLSGSLLSTQA